MTQRFQSEDLTDGSNGYLQNRPPKEGEADLRKLATQSLARCQVTPSQMRVAGQMGNFGYNDYALAVLTEPGEPSYLATVHYPYDGFPLDEVHREVGTMCSWLHALDHDTDVEIQVPIADDTGALCQLHDHRPDGLSAVCTVQRWVKGEDLVKDGDPVELPLATLHEIGTVLGRLHTHGAGWARMNDRVRIQTDWRRDSRARLQEAAST